MSLLLDTNAISEPGKDAPDPNFMAWWDGLREEPLFLSALTLGEMRRGIARLEAGQKRRKLERQYSFLRLKFSDQILPIDELVAEVWGDLSARLQAAGTPVGVADELIASTALVHGLTVVTRNVDHFTPTGCRTFCPWHGGDGG